MLDNCRVSELVFNTSIWGRHMIPNALSWRCAGKIWITYKISSLALPETEPHQQIWWSQSCSATHHWLNRWLSMPDHFWHQATCGVVLRLSPTSLPSPSQLTMEIHHPSASHGQLHWPWSGIFQSPELHAENNNQRYQYK